MNQDNFQTPILLIAWRRPGKTIKVIEKIKEIKARKIYVACDGFISDDKINNIKVQETREIIKNSINWECELKKLFSDSNQGCKKGVSNAINWFFKNEKEGIILEDDCLPHLDFFYFCEEMLRKYRFDDRIWSITGQNIQNNIWRGDSTYYFSKYSHCWGWASWRRCWEKYDRDIQNWPKFKKSKLLNNFFERKIERKYWENIFDNLYYKSKPDTWDYQWTLTCLINSGLTIIPNQNLIENIGFDNEATHTKTTLFNTKIFNFNRYTSKIFPIIHPIYIHSDKNADKYTELNCYSGHSFYRVESFKSFLKKIINKIKILNKKIFPKN